MRYTLLPVEALHFKVPTTQGLSHQGVLLAELFEDEFALVPVIFILSTATILASLSLVLWHI